MKNLEDYCKKENNDIQIDTTDIKNNLHTSEKIKMT